MEKRCSTVVKSLLAIRGNKEEGREKERGFEESTLDRRRLESLRSITKDDGVQVL